MTAARRVLLTADEVSARTTLKRSTLYHRAAKGQAPASFKLGGRRVWDEEVLEAWIASSEAQAAALAEQGDAA